MQINMNSIMKKVEAAKKTKKIQDKIAKVIEEYRKQGINKTVAGDDLTTAADITAISQKVIDDFIMIANSFGLPQSVMINFLTLSIVSGPTYVDGASPYYKVDIGFDHGALHRDSLYLEHPEYAAGIDNIIALFNNGYSARDYVYGIWIPSQGEGVYDITRDVRSRKDRAPLYFMQMGLHTVMMKYGAEYNMVVHLDEVYNK